MLDETVYVMNDEGEVLSIDVLRAPLQPSIKGVTDKRRYIIINEYLDDLRDMGISDPELMVKIHELYHVIHPKDGEYQTRKNADDEYGSITGEEVDTAGEYEKWIEGMNNKFN